MSISTPRHHVVALVYDGLCTFEFGCAVEVFSLERPELDRPWYRFSVAALEAGPLRAQGGLSVQVDRGLEALAEADTIVLPGWRDADEAPPEDLLEALRQAHGRGTRLASICSGVFLLAAAGLLDGRRATTHWRYAERLAARYPAIRVEPDVLYVDEGQILSSAGSAAGLDMLLHLVRRDHGPAVGRSVAQRLVIPPHREGGQAQFLPAPLMPEGRNRLSELLDWMAVHLHEPLSIESLAKRACMSPRSFQRQFREASGSAPYDWLLAQRVARAAELLENPDLSMTQVAEASGFASEESFRHHFRRLRGLPPGAYRRQFAQA
ncbi:MAG: transcriptional regulator FtrA [Gammaproteobacteria bacterium]|nr:transcriptional regulator FtrA [Gammaproteobacteria bacterium]